MRLYSRICSNWLRVKSPATHVRGALPAPDICRQFDRGSVMLDNILMHNAYINPCIGIILTGGGVSRTCPGEYHAPKSGE